MEIKRGSVWWWNCPDHSRSHIQAGVRPVVIVSNNTCNHFSEVVTVVPFTTQVRKPFPQQVPVVFNGEVSIALADQITSIPISELTRYLCDLHDFQMEAIDKGIAIQLGFVEPACRQVVKKPEVVENGTCQS